MYKCFPAIYTRYKAVGGGPLVTTGDVQARKIKTHRLTVDDAASPMQSNQLRSLGIALMRMTVACGLGAVPSSWLRAGMRVRQVPAGLCRSQGSLRLQVAPEQVQGVIEGDCLQALRGVLAVREQPPERQEAQVPQRGPQRAVPHCRTLSD